MDVDKAETRSRTLDADLPQNSRGELKIKGQARRSKWEDEKRLVSGLAYLPYFIRQVLSLWSRERVPTTTTLLGDKIWKDAKMN